MMMLCVVDRQLLCDYIDQVHAHAQLHSDNGMKMNLKKKRKQYCTLCSILDAQYIDFSYYPDGITTPKITNSKNKQQKAKKKESEINR